jgi:toxin ParE1/3/4
VKLAWSALAFADRDEIFDHISTDSPRAAVAVDDLIRRQAERLIDFPESGRPGRVEGTRELVINRSPYIAAYRIEGDLVIILRVLNGAREWPDDVGS